MRFFQCFFIKVMQVFRQLPEFRQFEHNQSHFRQVGVVSKAVESVNFRQFHVWSLASLLYTELNGVTFVIISGILKKWDNFLMPHDNICRSVELHCWDDMLTKFAWALGCNLWILVWACKRESQAGLYIFDADPVKRKAPSAFDFIVPVSHSLAIMFF